VPTVIMMSRDELIGRRATLLSDTGLPEDELRALAENYMLTPAQAARLAEIENIDFLLADE